MPHLKPKNLLDIDSSKGGAYRAAPRRVNLNYRKKLKVPFMTALKSLIVLAAVWTLVLGSAAAPTMPSFAATKDEERQALESQLKVLEGQITQYEGQISSYQSQGKSLKGEISQLNSKIAKLNLQIKAINITLSQLDQKISATQDQIQSTEQSIQSNRAAVGSLVKTLYQNEQQSLMEILMQKPKLSDFFSDMNNMDIVQENLRTTIKKITDLKDQLQDQKDQYATARADAATLKVVQTEQKQETDKAKQEKNTLLSVTKGQESKYQELLKVTKITASQIRNRLFELLGGGQLTFEQAYNYAKAASDATGVRPAMILAILDRESALGKNVGRCNWKTAMSPKNQTVFAQLTSELNLNPDNVSVSCPNADGPYGGAMGPAQFVPSTWNIYKNKIASISGHNPPSPWNNADAFIATALYLKDAGANSSEKMAAAKYYCGANWSRYVCTNVYGAAVVNKANQFQEDIATITN